MSFEFRPAQRENAGVLIALAGASGSGKTYSALRLAQGMVGGDMSRVAFIDTEARRGLHYADLFTPSFLHAEMRPPFRPERFMEAIRAAERTGAAVVIIDSFSHEYDGEGGLLDWAAELEGRGIKSPGNWKEPKLAHKQLMNALLQARASLIFCLRADEKIAIERKEVDDGAGRTRVKTVITPLGWMPICEKRFMYEMTASFTLTPDQPGIPRFDLPHKLQDRHRPFFPAGTQIGEASGAALAAWAKGGKATPHDRDEPTPPHRIDVPVKADDSGPDWRRWAARFVDAIGGAHSIEALDQWVTENAAPLKNLGHVGPKMRQRIDERIAERREQLAPEPGPEAA